MLVAAGAGCRRPPLVGESAPDAAVTDARTTGERPPPVVEAGQETMADSIAVHDVSSEPPAPDTLADVPEADVPGDRPGDAPADRSMADTPGDLTNSDTPPDIAPVPDAPLDMTPADRPADTTPEDRPIADGSDVRPDEQPCGPAGWICAPYRCDVARGQCFNSCITDDQCVSGRPCRANSCGASATRHMRRERGMRERLLRAGRLLHERLHPALQLLRAARPDWDVRTGPQRQPRTGRTLSRRQRLRRTRRMRPLRLRRRYRLRPLPPLHRDALRAVQRDLHSRTPTASRARRASTGTAARIAAFPTPARTARS